jgi:nucleotide-binding universal stress UspA family protein
MRLVEPATMADRQGTIHTIALATDLSPASDLATTRAIELAGRLGARLLVINVLERRRLSGPGSHDRDDQARAEREQALLPVMRRARDAGAHAEYIIWPGDPGSGVVAAVEAEQVDLLVVGTHGRDRAGRMLLGSVSDHLVRNAGCPVLVVPPKERDLQLLD